MIDVGSNIYDLVKRMRNSYNSLSSHSIYNFNSGGNTNLSGGVQIIGSTYIYFDHNKPLVLKNDSRPKSFGHVPNPVLVGFRCEIQILIDYLIQPHDEARVVGIVGAGGSGKTTLAKHIYHHPRIETRFTRKVWVCISQSWDKTSILNLMWRQVAQDPNPVMMEYDHVVYELSKLLSSHSYLVVLDDIWSIDPWYEISPALLPRISGSKVVVTTRNKFLPQRIDPSVLSVEPKQLNDEESYELFKMRGTFLDHHIPHELLALGKEMLRKCKGLPLAIVALAGVLRMDKSQSSWERLKLDMLNIANESTQGVVKEVLALSYNELPYHLKPCVLYLSIFPEDHYIDAEKLINMWIAEHLIGTKEDEVSTGEEYVDEMAQRCIVEVVETNYKGRVSRFRIHDLMRQMLVDMDQKRGFLNHTLRLAPSRTLYDDEPESNTSRTSEIIYIEKLQRIVGSEKSSHVCSLILLENVVISQHILLSFFTKFRLLRVVVLRRTDEIMPEAIGDLIHLRYLEFRGDIRRLPKSFGNLVNLWTLDLGGCYLGNRNRTALNTLYKLKELRHLYLPYCGRVDWGQVALDKPKLKALWFATGGCWMLSGMPELSAVLEDLRFHRIQSKEQLEAVFTTPSITSNNLETLDLEWYHGSAKLYDMSTLSKCQSLKKLSLRGEIGASTPLLLPPGLNQLEMWGTCVKDDEVMEKISKSCPNLKVLTLGSDAYTGSELVCNANSFPQLDKLQLDSLYWVKQWIIEESAMPRLHHLKIISCEKLGLNSQGWTSISKIPYVDVKYMPTEFVETLGNLQK